MNVWNLVRLILVIACISVALSSETLASAPNDERTAHRRDGGAIGDLKDPKLASQLVILADSMLADSPRSAGEQSSTALRVPLRADLPRLNQASEVQVYITVDDVSSLDHLASLGVNVQRVDEEQSLVQALVPADRLRAVAALQNVRSVRLPAYPFTDAGSVRTEGDMVIASDSLRAASGVDGTGLTVGVISDGVAGLAESQAQGDLPAVDTATCNVVGGDPGAAGAEGTALLEVVHDIAPGADLMFGYFGFGTVLEFNAAVDCLAANADVVVDDIGWFGVGPYDGTSLVSQNTADALNSEGPIKGYYTSVGNQAQRHYAGRYVDSGINIASGSATWDTHQFNAIDGTISAGAALAPSESNRFVLRPGGSATIIVVWDDVWGSSGNDYDLLVGDGTSIFPCGTDLQDGDDNPAEGCGVGNDGSLDANVDIYIGNFEGAAVSVTFDLFVLCSGCAALGNGRTLNFSTANGSVPNQSDAGGSPAEVVSVGAVWRGSPDDIERYSSRGPTNDGRIKPDVVAPDGVCATGSGGFAAGNSICQITGVQFFGTSASTPHVAALAALLLECDQTLTRLELRGLLTNTAIDLGDPGPDVVYGHGRVDAFAAGVLANCGPDADGDGCTDLREASTDETIGGARDPENPWDFYDVGGALESASDGVVDLANDILGVIQHYSPGGQPPYDAAFDRGPSVGPNPWNMTAPDGVIDLPNDILGVSQQYQHDCR